ncbi:uncharacterized protein LOC6548590 [Drosophila erecta]|uniref:C3H1-type domain-containing protein n=1 Tax=Drosophila erecta TaxID=7220 RepID=B3NKQ0_DROER|nr:uncharacterized protein LOC6548590 [Drosophila erecta]EDV54354.2 uncharacterized protein Dere_GG21471 [Drosophila erecta]
MSHSDENDENAILLTKTKPDSLFFKQKNAHMDGENKKPFRNRRNEHHCMAAAAPSVNLGITEPTEDFSKSASVNNTMSFAVGQAGSQPSSPQSSFVYKPFDYTLHGLTDFESTMSSTRKCSSQSPELFRKENYRFENSDAGLDDDFDSNDIFCSTMKDPQDIHLAFSSDECKINNINSISAISALEGNRNDTLLNCEMNELIERNHNRKKNIVIQSTLYNNDTILEAQENKVQSVDKDLYVKVSGKGSDHFICKQQNNNTLEPGELSEDTTSEAQKIQCAYKTSAVEDSEVSCEDVGAQHILIKKSSHCQFDNTTFTKRNIMVDKKVSELESGELFEDDQVEYADLEDGELTGEEHEVSCNTIKKDDNRMPICRFHIRNTCIWGPKCRFRHPKMNKLGKYVMFEKKFLPVPTVPFTPVWPTYILPSMDTYQTALVEKMPRVPESLGISFGLNDMDNDPYYTQNQPEVNNRAPLLPKPTFSEVLIAQERYNSLAGNRPIRTLSYSQHMRSTTKTIGMSLSTCFNKRDWSSSLPRYSASKNTQPQMSLLKYSNIQRSSSIIVRSNPKRQRLTDSTSSSSDSSESSSYKSTAESTDEVSSFSESDGWGTQNGSTLLGISNITRKQNEENFSSGAVAYLSNQAKLITKRPNCSKFPTQKLSPTQDYSKPSTKTPPRSPTIVLPSAPKKPHSILGNSYSIRKKQYRQKQLLVQLLRVEQQIAKKKKQRVKALKE